MAGLLGGPGQRVQTHHDLHQGGARTGGGRQRAWLALFQIGQAQPAAEQVDHQVRAALVETPLVVLHAAGEPGEQVPDGVGLGGGHDRP
ncbi:hypothetical protein GCM10023215_15470 [Pseudonocardia yuanmonensis]|uniref:Uncharacterized protein n=1 Tax=Pseudonocardia yuanmonensis TaxID=1095914 RepID=A0ABP8W8H6_9PSEU